MDSTLPQALQTEGLKPQLKSKLQGATGLDMFGCSGLRKLVFGRWPISVLAHPNHTQFGRDFMLLVLHAKGSGSDFDLSQQTLNTDANRDCRKIYIGFAQFFSRTDRRCITSARQRRPAKVSGPGFANGGSAITMFRICD